MSMGQHCERMAREWQVSREDQDRLAMESHLNADRAYNEGFFDELVQPWSGVTRDNNIRGDSNIEQLAKLRTVFSKGSGATMTAGNSTPLTDGAASVFDDGHAKSQPGRVQRRKGHAEIGRKTYQG